MAGRFSSGDGAHESVLNTIVPILATGLLHRFGQFRDLQSHFPQGRYYVREKIPLVEVAPRGIGHCLYSVLQFRCCHVILLVSFYDSSIARINQAENSRTLINRGLITAPLSASICHLPTSRAILAAVCAVAVQDVRQAGKRLRESGFVVAVCGSSIPELRGMPALPSERDVVAMAGRAFKPLRCIKN
jgi:hypothetical protein